MTHRYFWRRFFAFFIDSIVMNRIVAIPVLLITSIFAGSMPGSTAYSNNCKPAQPPAAIHQQMNIQPDELVTMMECHPSTILEKSSKIYMVFVLKRDGKPHFPRMASFRDDGSGLERIPDHFDTLALVPQVAIVFLLPAAFALFSAHGRQTLGKKLMRLKVLRTDDSYPMLPQALRREYWKFLPELILFTVIIVIVLTLRDAIVSYLDDALSNMDLVKFFKVFAIIPALQLFIAAWWLLPFIFWRGQTWHDRLAGTKVVSVEQA